jgi:hypothetical protein
MADASTGNNGSHDNGSHNNNAEKAYLRQREEGMKEIAKLDMTNPVMLLDKLPSYRETNEEVFLEIVLNLEKLSESKPDAFVQYPAIFNVFFDILYNSFIEYENIVKSVIRILKNISRTPEHIAVLKMKLDREDPSTRMTKVLRGLFMTSEILPIFDMRAIMASEGEPPHVYAIQGHGCVFDKRPPIIVPKGIIWIELTVCGLVAYVDDIKKFINRETKSFLENTPIPTNEPSRQKYRADLGALTDYGIGVKFPGQPIADGKNSLFLQAFNEEGIPADIFFKSGIDRLYTKPLNTDDYKAVKGSVDTYSKIYSDSIYPTLDQVMDDDPTQDSYVITFKNLFASIESQDYEVTKPMILINVGCRTPCADLNLSTPALRRQNSEEAKTKMVSELPIDELYRHGREKYLMSLIKQKLFLQARLLMERVERAYGLGVSLIALKLESILEKIRYEGEPIVEGKETEVVPKEFKDLIKSKISEYAIEIKFREFTELVLNDKANLKWPSAFMELVGLARTHKEGFLAYEGLLDKLVFIFDRKKKVNMFGVVSELIRTIATTEEDKARLATTFAKIPVTKGKTRSESIADLGTILKDCGIIKAGGTRKKKRTRKLRRTVRRELHYK